EGLCSGICAIFGLAAFGGNPQHSSTAGHLALIGYFRIGTTETRVCMRTLSTRCEISGGIITVVISTRVRSSRRVLRSAAASGDRDLLSSIEELSSLAIRALEASFVPAPGTFVQTVRRGPSGLKQEGTNLRYAAIVALGLAQLDDAAQSAVLGGSTAADFARRTADLVVAGPSSNDLGAVALAAWAVAEIAGELHSGAFDRLIAMIDSSAAHPTVDYSWALTAMVAARHLADFDEPMQRAAARLLTGQGSHGIFGHYLPRSAQARYRAHVSCFADQVYPIQALSRFGAATGDLNALAAANRCAQRIVELQGSAGQWWWHYDARTGDVVEKYPVYSVHQHAMAPMALFDLYDNGGVDHRDAVLAGLKWVTDHPESDSSLLDDETGAIWRKIGRREPRKMVRSLRAISTAVSPKLKLGLLDTVFRPGPIDYECRPYELGWLLYAWLSAPDSETPLAVARSVEDRSTSP
ncbi:MAG: hypothetical protein JWM76_4877, partial [Pseudonocardiales bacterium]|nr:hypothetical protein [Pseudonocardiales bacterium]